MADEWDFGFTTEDEIKADLLTEQDKAAKIRDMIMPLLNNLKKNPDKDIIKWAGKDRVKQIDTFIAKMNSLVG